VSSVAVRRRRRRVLGGVGGGVLALAVVATGWVGLRAWQASQELTALAPMVAEAQAAASARDSERLGELLIDIGAHADRAAELSSTPIWRAVEVVPGLGPNLEALRAVSEQLSSVADAVAEPAQTLLAMEPAALDVGSLRAQEKPLAAAASALATARDTLNAIQTDRLLAPLARGVTELTPVIDALASATDGLADAAAVLPGLAGADGPRTILVMLQNSAELRTGGGITGTFAEIRAEDGEFTLVRQVDSSQFEHLAAPIVPLPAATVALYGDVVGRFVQNATMPADFALSAQLALAWWERSQGTTPDAIIAVDPLVVKALIAATGPVALTDGSTLDADGLVQRLLVDPYLHLDSDAQTALQREVTASVFSALVARVDPVVWAAALADPVAAGRVSVWSAVPAEQRVLAATAVGGPLARLDAAGPSAFGVFLNDATAGKMDSHLGVALSAETSCTGESVVTVTLSHTADAAAVAAYPMSMTGGGLWGTGAGDIGTTVTVAAPAGSVFGGATGEEGRLPSVDVVADGHPSTAVRVNISPGQTESVQFRFTQTRASSPVPAPVLVHTPTLTPVESQTPDSTRPCA
jgi:hypothetical protein